MKLLSIGLIAALLAGGGALASEAIEVRSLQEGAPTATGNIEQLGWLTGYWEGEGLGGKAVEMVAPAEGGQMMGAFRHDNADGGPNFYEFYLFAEIEDSLVLRIKHFTPDLIGWEEKAEFVEFPLVAVEKDAVYFDGVSFVLTGEGKMQSAVKIDGQGVFQFRYRAAKLE
ncbi:MAG: DUF6265 family protein [Pseudomonadota bacterium]